MAHGKYSNGLSMNQKHMDLVFWAEGEWGTDGSQTMVLMLARRTAAPWAPDVSGTPQQCQTAGFLPPCPCFTSRLLCLWLGVLHLLASRLSVDGGFFFQYWLSHLHGRVSQLITCWSVQLSVTLILNTGFDCSWLCSLQTKMWRVKPLRINQPCGPYMPELGGL